MDRKTAIYVRQSVLKKDSMSLEAQIDKCKAKLVDDEEYEIYKDVKSGGTDDRPGLQKLKQDIKDGEIGKIIVYKLDRLSRSTVDFYNMYENEIKANDVNLVATDDPVDTCSDVGEFVIGILINFAQMELNTIKRRVNDSYYDRLEIGFYPGGKPPYGYDKAVHFIGNKKTAKYVINKEEARIVKFIFNEYIKEGVTIGKLVEQFNTNEKYKCLTTRGKSWRSAAVSRIIRNPAYTYADVDMYQHLAKINCEFYNDEDAFIGETSLYQIKAGGKKGKNVKQEDEVFISIAPHRPIVPSDLWIKCQTKADNGAQIKNIGKGTHSWLSGLMKCGYCELAVTVVNSYRKNPYTLTCGGRKRRICYGREKPIHLDDVEYIVQAKLLHFMKNKVVEIADTKEELIYKDKKLMNKLKAERLYKVKSIDRLIEALKASEDAERPSKLLMQKLNDDANKLEDEIAKLDEQIAELIIVATKKNVARDTVKKAIDNWSTFNIEEKKKIAKAYIKKVYVTDTSIDVIFY